ncbi:LysR family transcriptional regulator [Sphingosinicella sp. CPCC 101087]|uniref:LysR family transcriptional regulator n=1 Tax=Sphingosinicella sp. CPCC 101087 TaxID=2497754 RepID=UPI00101D7DCC|nr:LysR family transcriptional regulator [Sphingosinicella sp. CPCC 101087]
MFDWDDLRHFLAVAETASTLAAGRKLRVSQTTVARRIAALEAALGLILFERRQAGYVLTPAGEALIERARCVEGAATALADAAAAQTREVGGLVRLTVGQALATTVLPPVLRDLYKAHPGIRIELDTSDATRDLAAGAADIALRISVQPTGSGLVGRRVASDDWSSYCSRPYAAAHGLPRSIRQLRSHPLVGGGGEGIWQQYLAWLREHDLEDAVAMHYDSVTGLLAAVRAGFGVAALPCFVADNDPDLIRCLPPRRKEERGIWLLTHERLRHTPRVRVVLDFLGDRLARLAREGERRAAADLASPPIVAL